MSGNSTFRHTNTTVLSVTAVDAPVVKTSEEFDAEIAESYARTRIQPGMLARLAGIRERRWWPEGVSFTDGAVEAGAKAMAEAGVDPARVGLMVNTSVSRQNLEPSVAVGIHEGLGMPSDCLNFDLANACLGFVNGMQVAASMIDTGQIDYALVVAGESTREPQQATLERLAHPDTTAEDLTSQFATLTLGSGATAMVLGRADQHPEGHRVIGGVSRAATEHHELCVGDFQKMRTDTKGLLTAGISLASALWEEARDEFDWADMDRYIVHQVSQVHTGRTCDALGIDNDRVPLTFPTRGNIGPASVPFTLALEVDSLQPEDRVLLMGIGSGLNMTCLELQW